MNALVVMAFWTGIACGDERLPRPAYTVDVAMSSRDQGLKLERGVEGNVKATGGYPLEVKSGQRVPMLQPGGPEQWVGLSLRMTVTRLPDGRVQVDADLDHTEANPGLGVINQNGQFAMGFTSRTIHITAVAACGREIRHGIEGDHSFRFTVREEATAGRP